MFLQFRVVRAVKSKRRRGADGMNKKEMVRGFFERVWNALDKASMGDFLHEDVTVRGSLGNNLKGFQELGEYVDRVHLVLGDFQGTVEAMVAEGDQVFAKMLYTATHTGELYDQPPTGRKIRWWGAALFTFEDGLITDVWVVGNQKALELQLQGLDGSPGSRWGL